MEGAMQQAPHDERQLKTDISCYAKRLFWDMKISFLINLKHSKRQIKRIAQFP